MSPLVSFVVASLAAFLVGGANAQPPGTKDAAAVSEAREILDAYSGDSAKLLRAKALIDRVLAENPSNVEAMKQSARLTQMAGSIGDRTAQVRGRPVKVGSYQPGTLERAEAILRDALKVDPGFAGGYVLLGHVLTEQLRIDDAAAALRKAEELGSDDPWLQLNWAVLHDLLGEHDSAMKRLKAVLDKGTDNKKALAAAYDLQIEHYRRQGMHELAIAAYREQAKRAPDNAWVRGNLASYFCTLHRYEEAIAEARVALRMMNYGAARRVLATCLYGRYGQLMEAGKAEEARPYFEEARGLEPDLQDVMFRLGPDARRRGLVRALLAEKRVPVNARHGDGSTMLLIFVNKNDPGGVSLMLSQGADPNIGDYRGWTPLISAADEGNEANVRMLLAAGADRSAMRQGKTAEAQAEAKGHSAIAKLIREHAPAGSR